MCQTHYHTERPLEWIRKTSSSNIQNTKKTLQKDSES